MYSRMFVDEHWNLIASILGNFAVMFSMLISIDGISGGEPASMASVAGAIALLLCVNSVWKFRKYRQEE